MVKETQAVLRWAARLLGLPPLALVATQFVGGGPPDLSKASANELGLLVCLTAAMLGLVLLWRWELAGGLLTIAGVAVFYAIYYAAEGRFPAGAAMPFLLGPALLSITSWGLGPKGRGPKLAVPG